MKKQPTQTPYELRDPEVPIVRGATSEAADTLAAGKPLAPTQPHN